MAILNHRKNPLQCSGLLIRLTVVVDFLGFTLPLLFTDALEIRDCRLAKGTVLLEKEVICFPELPPVAFFRSFRVRTTEDLSAFGREGLLWLILRCTTNVGLLH